MGLLDERAHSVRNLEASRRQPSMQLVGSSGGETLDLGVLQAMGIRMVGRARSAEGLFKSLERCHPTDLRWR